MSSKKPSKNSKLDFGKLLSKAEFFYYTVENDNRKEYGLTKGKKFVFRKTVDFSDGDFIYIRTDSYVRVGFGFSMNNSILIGMLFYHPVPRKEIQVLGVCVNPEGLNRNGI